VVLVTWRWRPQGRHWWQSLGGGGGGTARVCERGGGCGGDCWLANKTPPPGSHLQARGVG
jgi:hypothetical protein